MRKQPTRIGINGFGRIGRKIARLVLQRDDIELVGINGLSSPEQMAHFLKYDSVHGTLAEEVSLEGQHLRVGRHKIALSAEKNPEALSWRNWGAEFVHECTGVFTKREKAALHLQSGAQRVIISAPSPDPDWTVCMGVNDSEYDPSRHQIISNASCTTNCLAPLVKVLDDTFGVIRGTLLTVHSYTNDQQLLDLNHSDLRRSRAAALSQIPTSTGAAKAVGLVIPHLKGKLDGFAVRVPTPNVSMVDLTCEVRKSTTREEIHSAFEKAAQGPLKGILKVSHLPLVSIDFNGCELSSTLDAGLTYVIEGNLVKVVSWYDNESGFSARMLDLTRHMAQRG